jgi:hypothetical protein
MAAVKYQIVLISAITAQPQASGALCDFLLPAPSRNTAAANNAQSNFSVCT